VSHRTRLADADGISAKAAIDGLVHAGVIRDDSTKEVREVSYLQVKVKNKNEEKTVIQIRRVSE
jgi:Holliday junction resolvase RusA-like endonuclease